MTLSVDGRDIAALEGDSLAVAMLLSDERILSRSAKYHRPRSAFCLAGHCGGCLVRVDDEPNVRACRTTVAEGMTVERQNAFPSARIDLLGATDRLFSRGLDHHTLMTSFGPLNALMQRVVRRASGLGRLPGVARTGHPSTEPDPEIETLHVDVAVIGGGPAGLACADAVARTLRAEDNGRRVLVVDEQDHPGGSYLAHPDYGLAAAQRAIRLAAEAGVEIRTHTTALAYYPEDRAPGARRAGLLALRSPAGLSLLTAERYVYATGAYEQNLLFEDNDRPGVLAARAVGRLVTRWGVVPARRVALVGSGPFPEALARALERLAVETVRIDGAAERPLRALGSRWVRAIEVAGAEGARRIDCDLVAVFARPAPASELPRQHGVPAEWSAEAGGFPARTRDQAGATDVDGVYCAGDVTGFVGVEPARAHGAWVGAALARGMGRQ